LTPHVAVIGAGPVGVLSALLLARQDISVTLVDRGASLTTESRASTFHPSTLDLLVMMGVDLAAHSDAVRVTSVQWRDNCGAVLAEVDYRLLEGITGHPFRVHLDQQSLLDQLAVLLTAESRVTARFGLTAVGLDPSRPEVTVSSADGQHHTITADAVIGCDGAHSAVRSLSAIPFPVAAYPTGAIRAYTAMDLAAVMPANKSGRPLSGLCYFRGRGDGVSALQMNTDTRLIVRTRNQQDDESRLHEAVANATPWSIDDLDIRRIDSYRLQRGVAKSYLCECGPVLILGDAAHALMPVVADWLHGRVGRSALELLAASRRNYLLREVIPRGERRVRGLQDPDRDSLNGHLADLDQLSADSAAARQFLIEASLLDTPLTAVSAS
jgi:2-polyprenyl-6-methoxyphenol hydroxylase-like FAD-dependent oxidoreductase